MAFSIPTPDVHAWLLSEFPNLRNEQHSVTSPFTDEYNCIAWAAADIERWWWPSPNSYWPEDLPRIDSVENFVRAFQQLDYQPCDDGSFEAGYEKVVIYVGADGRVKHMARQVDAVTWTSKLGQAWDIEHATPQGVACETYGRVAQFLRRPMKAEWGNLQHT